MVTAPRAREPIAVVGIGCRFPGAADPRAFWDLLANGVDAVGEIPRGRLDVDRLYDPQPATPGRMMTRWGGFLDDIERFDAAFFGIAPREAERMDPQQRLLLELAWEALEDGGQVPARLAGSRTGVFVGIWISDYETRMFRDPEGVDFYMTTGTGRYTASGRLSHFFGFRGPSLTVDTACSSSLVAVHLACQSLWSGESEVALAGGANVVIEPTITIAYSQSRMMAPDGRCRFGDARASGYVRSDGAGIVVLKPLSRARAGGDPVYAVILGSAVNNDGGSGGSLGTPGRPGQEDLLRAAYRHAGIEPRDVQYVEAHGTGTGAGDPVELHALGSVLGAGRAPERPCLVGSVKTNVGHTEGAAGVAGLIKVARALGHGTVPASLHFETPNPAVSWDELRLEIPRSTRPWPPCDGPRRAGVSSFGIAGTNAHVVLEARPEDAVADPEPEPPARRAALLPVSAHTAEARASLARAYRDTVERAGASLDDLCHTAGVRRTHHPFRLAVVGRTREEVAARLNAFLRGEPSPGVLTGGEPARRRKLAFVFPGQGSQWLGMGRQLLREEPVFRGCLERCGEAIARHAGWSLLDEIEADAARSRLDRIDVVQPVLFALQVAIAALWRAWGVEPDAVVGHSMGEVAAAHVAGALTLDDAVRIICGRSRLMRRLSGRGAMAVVELSIEEAEAALRGREDRLSVAVANSARSTVLSGDLAALEEVIAALAGQGVFCRRVNVDVASHSPQMDALRPELLDMLASLRPRAGSIPLYSTVDAAITGGAALDADYWVRNLRAPVRFAAAVDRLLADGHDAFVEVSPHPVLLPALQQGAVADGRVVVVPSLRRDEEERSAMLESLGMLYAAGHPIAWERLYPRGRCVPAPSYPWQRERLWWDGDRSSAPAGGGRRSAVADARAVLGPRLTSSVDPATHFWEMALTARSVSQFADHVVQGSVVVPAVAYLDMALAAAEDAFGPGARVVEDVAFANALALSEAPRPVQLVLSEARPGTITFRCSSRVPAAPPAAWILHAAGTLTGAGAPAPPASLAEIRARCPLPVPASDHYAHLARRGLDYGPSFHRVAELWRGTGETLCRLTRDGRDAAAAPPYPLVLDACLQGLLAALVDAEPGPDVCLVPTGVGRVVVHADRLPDGELWAHASGRSPAGDEPLGHVRLFDGAGRVLLEARDVRFAAVAVGAAGDPGMYEIAWRPKPRSAGAAVAPGGDWLVFADDRGVGDRLAERLCAEGARTRVVRRAGSRGGGEVVAPERREDFDRVVAGPAAGAGRWAGVVHLWSLDAPEPRAGAPAALAQAEALACHSVLHLAQALAKSGAPGRLWIVTAGAQPVPDAGDDVAVAQAGAWGLAAVVATEHPELRCTRVDLGREPSAAEVVALHEECRGGDAEDQVAIRAAVRYVARLVRRLAASLPEPPRQRLDPDRPFRVTVGRPGILDSLVPRLARRRLPGDGEVEIEVRATGLNFMNVMSALGLYPGYEDGVGPLGIECAGTVTAVGRGVQDLRPGMEVLAIALDSLGSHAVTDARLVARRPAGIDASTAATLPIAFVTAFYALHHLARLEAGERVLIHAAAGGVGLAAVQLARRAGAEVFATAGSAEKRAFLTGLGVPHVLDSRSLAFAGAVEALTGGRGVDVVVNSLAGDAMAASLGTLAPYGRFVELGKRDIHENVRVGLRPFRRALSYFAVDLERMIRERPAFVGGLLGEVLARVARGELEPLPVRTFPVGAAADAFRHMAQARHIGRIAISLSRPERADLAALPPAPDVGADAAYVVTGGLGGLGLAVSEWLVAQGARHLVLVGRRAPSAAAQAALDRLRAAGADVVVAQADVARREELAAVLSALPPSRPLRGVVHAAGVLEDGALLHLDAERFHAAMAPKVDGAWNLHALTQGQPLEFFVLFSSVAPCLGLAGQGNYAAANAFLDGLASHRRAAGRPALSIAWGPWSGVGLAAARADRGGRLRDMGLGSLTPKEGVAAFARLLGHPVARACVMRFDADRWTRNTGATPLLAELTAPAEGPAREAPPAAGGGDVRAALHGAPGPRRRSLLETYLQEQVASVLRLAPSRVDPGKPLRALGLDSLMALELRNRLEAGLGLRLPATLVWNYPTVAALATHLAGKLGLALAADPETPGDSRPRASADAPGPGAAVPDVEALVADELARVERLLKEGRR